MRQFTVQLTRIAAKELDDLAVSDRDRLIQELRELKSGPIGPPPRIKRLKGFSFPLYRLRSGDYRVLYRVDDSLITVMRIINRRDLERTLRRLR